MTQNLLAPQGDNKDFAVNVDDHDDDDVTLPQDIMGGDMGESVAFWQQPGIKIWLYVLGGAVAIFVVAFVVLSQQSSLFKGSTIDTTTIEGDEGFFFDDYSATNGSSSNSSSTPASTSTASGDETFVDGTASSSTTTTTATSSGDESFVDNTTTTTTSNTATDDYSYSDGGIAYDPNQFLNTTYGTQSETEFGFGDPAQGYNDAGALPEVTDAPPTTQTEVPAETQTTADYSPTLETNTEGAVMSAPEVQGNTGPGIWISFLPVLAYSALRKKSRI